MLFLLLFVSQFSGFYYIRSHKEWKWGKSGKTNKVERLPHDNDENPCPDEWRAECIADWLLEENWIEISSLPPHQFSCFILVSCRFVVAFRLFNFSLVFLRISRLWYANLFLCFMQEKRKIIQSQMRSERQRLRLFSLFMKARSLRITCAEGKLEKFSLPSLFFS